MIYWYPPVLPCFAKKDPEAVRLHKQMLALYEGHSTDIAYGALRNTVMDWALEAGAQAKMTECRHWNALVRAHTKVLKLVERGEQLREKFEAQLKKAQLEDARERLRAVEEEVKSISKLGLNTPKTEIEQHG